LERKEVKSSNIHSIGYSNSENILEIEFHARDIYHYYNVPEQHYTNLINPNNIYKSHGKYLNREIKGIYKFEKIF
jgi:hypothetical protein